MKTVLLTLVAALVVAGSALASPPPGASILIRHQVKGCHSWAVNGGAFKPSQTLTLARGAVLTITNNDVMPHTLIKLLGPAVRLKNGPAVMTGMGMHGKAAPGVMNRMGAVTSVFFPKAGTYVFKTKAGEDYMPGMKTIGEDNVLRLTVTVR